MLSKEPAIGMKANQFIQPAGWSVGRREDGDDPMVNSKTWTFGNKSTN
jgi:hypothetical protein